MIKPIAIMLAAIVVFSILLNILPLFVVVCGALTITFLISNAILTTKFLRLKREKKQLENEKGCLIYLFTCTIRKVEPRLSHRDKIFFTQLLITLAEKTFNQRMCLSSVVRITSDNRRIYLECARKIVNMGMEDTAKELAEENNLPGLIDALRELSEGRIRNRRI